jgi:2-hydroxy-6-oxonona-2,4-dienedioate hydrolase
VTARGRAARWAAAALAAVVVAAAAWIAWCFERDIAAARSRATQGSVLVDTRCGPIEYQDAGAGVPLLMVHGSGGGHDQGMAFAGDLPRPIPHRRSRPRRKPC